MPAKPTVLQTCWSNGRDAWRSVMHDAAASGILVSILFTTPLLGQVDSIPTLPVGIIDFYGLRTVSEGQVRNVLGISEGDSLRVSAFFGDEVKRRLTNLPGVERARLELVCCEENKLVVFVGIEETAVEPLKYHTAPRGRITLPEEVVDTYRAFNDALMEAVRSGDAGDDLSQGHSLMQNPAVRQLQERFLGYAEHHLDTLRQVLRNAADSEQRKIAAWVIGYAQDKRSVVDDLLYAVLDPDHSVRNNAARALGAIATLANRRPGLGIEIDPAPFIDMLNSLVWTDRNKAFMVLLTLTERRDPRVLEQLRQRALLSLVDIARWKSSYALGGYGILGRMTELTDEELQDAWEKGERERVIARFVTARPPP